MLAKLVKTNNSYGLFILRVITGIVFMAHGSQKLFGLFGGGGLEGTGQFMESIGLAPGYLMALLSGSGEFFGGLLLALGLFIRLAAVNTLIISIIAFFTVHMSKGFFMATGGFEYILILATISVLFIFEGAGKYSVDKSIENNIR